MVFHREQLAGSRKATLHFVGNQQNSVRIAQFAQGLHKIGGGNVEPPPLNRFGIMAATVRRNVGFEDAFEAFNASAVLTPYRSFG